MIGFNIKQLEAFVAVVECGTFTAASEALFLTQSTISAHIMALENTLGVTLLTRQTRRQICMTQDGKRVYQQAKKILSECKTLEEMTAIEEKNPNLCLGASTVPGQYLLPGYLAGFLHRRPDCHYIIRRGDSEDVHGMLRNGDIRMGFVGAIMDPDAFIYVPLADDRLVLATANNERYRSLKTQGVLGRALLSEPTVAREEGSGTDRSVINYMKRIGFPKEELNIVARVEDPESIKQLVAQNIGVSVLSALAVNKEAEEGDLLIFDMDKEPLKRTVYLITRRDIEYSNCERQFIEFLKNESKRR